MPEQLPLILTLQLDEQAFAFFNGLRKKHFPPAINYLDAHLTLFHHLPPVPEVTEDLQTFSEQQELIALEVANLMKLGRGVAYGIKSQELMRVHSYLQKKWFTWLTPQDRQGFRPHITVQNKVNPETANALFMEIASGFTPFAAHGTGLSLWEYQGGPWRHIQNFNFLASASQNNK